MAVVGYLIRAELRSRWRSWLAIAVLISLVGGFVLAATAAGRRTESAFPSFVAAHGYNAVVFADHAVPKLATLPGVASATMVVGPDPGQPSCACTRPIDPTDLTIMSAPVGPRPLYQLEAGRLPDPSAPDQVLASFNLEQDEGVRPGTVIHVPTYAKSQLAELMEATGVQPEPRGPVLDLHVVGIEASEGEFPSGTTPSYTLITSTAFDRTVDLKTANYDLYLVSLRRGAAGLPRFDAQANALFPDGVIGTQSMDELATSVEASIRPQAVGWWVLAALAAVVGLAVVGQALARQTFVESEEYPTLAALGTDRRRLLVLMASRNLLVGTGGAVGSLLLALALSPMGPVGEARLAESATGLEFDAPVLVLGTLIYLAVIVGLGMWPALRVLRRRAADRGSAASAPVTVERLAAMGAPPAALIGVRNALYRRSGGPTIPVGTALLGTVLAVVALCGTLVFGSSLAHLTSTPTLYGDSFQLNFTVLPGSPLDPPTAGPLRRDGAVTAITRGLATQLLVDHRTVGAVAASPLEGPLLFTAVTGRAPSGDDQIGLGSSTMRQLGVRVGSTVAVTVSPPTGVRRTVPFHVVSQISFPVLGGTVGLGTGALLTIAGYEGANCPPGPQQAMCRGALVGDGNGGMLVRVSPGPRGRAAVTRYLDRFPSTAALPTTPTSLVNFGEAVNFPLIFGVVLAIFGAATLAHLLVVSVSRRRREMGLLKVLGFVNRQVMATVGWQATTVAMVGVLVGIPLGVVVGRAVWRMFADWLGAVAEPVVPLWWVGLLAASVLAVANLLALWPAVVATRAKPDRLLREQ